MTKTAKILIGVGGGLLVLAIIAIVALVLAMNWVEKNLTAGVKADMEAGAEFARSTDQKGCMIEGLRRSKSITMMDFSKGMGLSTFVESCMKAAPPTPEICNGVPGFWSLQKSEWIADQCRQSGLDQQRTGCFYVYTAKHNVCSKPM